MTKVSKSVGASNVEKEDAFRTLERHAAEYNKAPEPKIEKAFSRFLRGLTDSGKERICRCWLKLSRVRQDELLGTLNALGGVLGPAVNLMHAIRDAQDAWVDALPSPPPAIDPQQTEECRAILVRSSGLPEDKVREILAEPVPSDEDMVRHGLLAMGVQPAEVDQSMVVWRRQGKLAAVNDVAEPAAQAARAKERDDEMRKVVPRIAELSKQAARDVSALCVAPQEAQTMLEGILASLLGAVNESGVVGAPARWSEIVTDAVNVVGAMAEGKIQDANWLLKAARNLASMAKEAEDLAAKLKRKRGRPSKPALNAAAALKAQGLTWSQTAMVLDENELNLKSHSAETVRKSVQARRSVKPPARK